MGIDGPGSTDPLTAAPIALSVNELVGASSPKPPRSRPTRQAQIVDFRVGHRVQGLAGDEAAVDEILQYLALGQGLLGSGPAFGGVGDLEQGEHRPNVDRRLARRRLTLIHVTATYGKLSLAVT